MKPDWKDAPEWAEWVAMDCDGKWYWYEKEPLLSDDGLWYGGGEYQKVITLTPDLEQRPS